MDRYRNTRTAAATDSNPIVLAEENMKRTDEPISENWRTIDFKLQAGSKGVEST